MARDDDGRRKPKGTLALDITDMDLDGDDPPPKASKGRRGGRDRGRDYGRKVDDEPSGRRGGGRGGGGGKGTLALDISEMDLDDDYGTSRSASRPGRSGAQWGGDDEPDRGRRSKGGRQVEQWRDDDDRYGERYDSPSEAAPSRPTKPSPGISDADLERTGFVSTATATQANQDATRSIDQFDLPEEPSRPSARLTLKAGEAGQPVHTLDKDVIKVGREVDNDVVLLDAQASRYHFELRRRGSSFELRDLESGNGTFVNGHKVSRITLTEGAVVRVGGTELVFDLVAPSSRPKGGLSAAATEAAPAPPAPDAPPPAALDTPDADDDAEQSGFPLPVPILAALGGVALLAFVFVTLLAVFLLTGDGDEPTKGGGGVAAGDGDLDLELGDELPADVMVEPALSRADKAFAAGDWLSARRHLLVAQKVAPGNKRAKEFLGRVDRALQTEDTPALRVTFEPERPKRGKPLAIRVRLEQPVQEVRASFMGQRLVLRPSPDVPREYVGEMMLPKKTKKGEKELDVELIDLQEERFEFARRVVVK